MAPTGTLLDVARRLNPVDWLHDEMEVADLGGLSEEMDIGASLPIGRDCLRICVFGLRCGMWM